MSKSQDQPNMPCTIDFDAPYPEITPDVPFKDYQVFVGIKHEVLPGAPIAEGYESYLGSDEHWAVIVRAPQPADPLTDCTWYHTLGCDLIDQNHYRRTVTHDRSWMNTVFNERIPVGLMKEEQTWDFKKAFKSTPPQPSDFFVARFLRKLAQRGILDGYQVSLIEDMVGDCPEGLVDDPDYKDSPVLGPEPEGDQDVFEMEL
ncbi:hypothetical protein BDV18DRAFT_160558 [Aspergillus unguis]